MVGVFNTSKSTIVQLSDVAAFGWLEYVSGGNLGAACAGLDASSASFPVCGSNTLIFCGLPSCKTVKSDSFSPGIGRPCLSVTTTSTCTRRAVVRKIGFVPALSAGGGAVAACGAVADGGAAEPAVRRWCGHCRRCIWRSYWSCCQPPHLLVRLAPPPCRGQGSKPCPGKAGRRTSGCRCRCRPWDPASFATGGQDSVLPGGVMTAYEGE